MKVLQINTRYKNGGSTGRIVYDLMQVSELNGIEAYVAYGYEFDNEHDEHTLCMEGKIELTISKLQSRIFARHGFYNQAATKRLLNYLADIQPDIIHLHNMHNHYVHNEMVFEYIKKHDIPVVWTLHDCWSFTGWCAYFDYAKCGKWRTHCHSCPCKNDYPFTWFSARARSNFDLKQKTFCGVKQMTLVTPSQWLADLTRYSFLKDYPVKVINNGVDTSIFRPCSNDAKEKLGVKGKKLFLAMASGFGIRKGGDYLRQLPELLNDDEVLVLVGKGASVLAAENSTKVIGIEYTNDVQELASYYSAADVFINPTLEDNFPTTNIEALACGTPVVTFDTGGSVEAILAGGIIMEDNNVRKTNVGAVVLQGDIHLLLNAAREICIQGKTNYTSYCREKACERYDKKSQYQKYVELYKSLIAL